MTSRLDYNNAVLYSIAEALNYDDATDGAEFGSHIDRATAKAPAYNTVADGVTLASRSLEGPVQTTGPWPYTSFTCLTQLTDPVCI